MATLTSVLSDYETNADYDDPPSTSKARKFRSACRKLLAKMPTEAAKDEGANVKHEVRLIAEELRRVEGWLQVNRDSDQPRVTFPDFVRDRGV